MTIKFELNLDHIKLVKRLNIINYHDSQIPNIDIKRPFGNSNIGRDISEILGLPIMENDNPLLDKYLDDLTDMLQIVCQYGHTPGVYTHTEYGTEWKPYKSKEK